MYNTRLNAVIFGEAGDDVLTGDTATTTIIGGQGMTASMARSAERRSLGR
jgi:hypothetical protein